MALQCPRCSETRWDWLALINHLRFDHKLPRGLAFSIVAPRRVKPRTEDAKAGLAKHLAWCNGKVGETPPVERARVGRDPESSGAGGGVALPY